MFIQTELARDFWKKIRERLTKHLSYISIRKEDDFIIEYARAKRRKDRKQIEEIEEYSKYLCNGQKIISFTDKVNDKRYMAQNRNIPANDKEKLIYYADKYIEVLKELWNSFESNYSIETRVAFDLAMNLRKQAAAVCETCEHIYAEEPHYTELDYNLVHSTELKVIKESLNKDFDDVICKLVDAIETEDKRKYLSVSAIILMLDLQLEQIDLLLKE